MHHNGNVLFSFFCQELAISNKRVLDCIMYADVTRILRPETERLCFLGARSLRPLAHK